MLPTDTSGPRSADLPAASLPEKKECDLVMKGGITSGVVYPPAVLKLSEQYRFRSVGGASAGAIAAAMTVAAEYGRQAGTGTKFAGIKAVQKDLLEKSFLTGLFQPAPKARFLFDTLLMAQEIGARPAWLKVPGYLALCGRVVVGLWWMIRGLVCINSRESFFGFCTGLAAEGEPEQLTNWLHQRIADLSGKKREDGPLTCADLATQGITLKVVTTNLSKAQPIALPMKDRSFLFKEEEFRRLFPEEVVRYLVAKSAGYSAKHICKLPAGYYHFPSGGELPVIVAARMSLSFPVLLSAVPLYSLSGVAYREARKHPDGSYVPSVSELSVHWFSDGGIANNFPIQFFDTWLPTRPTFGLTLADSPLPGVLSLRRRPRKEDLKGKAEIASVGKNAKGEPEQVDVLMLHARDTEDIKVLLPTRKIGGLGSFLGAVFDTAQSYRDNMQSVLPSYRERIATVFLDPGEGGLNLGMDEATILRLMKKGDKAADLIDDFSLEEHRWVRFLVLMSQIERELSNVRLDGNGRMRSIDELRGDFEKMVDAMEGSFGGDRAFYRSTNDRAWVLQAERRMSAFFTLMDAWEKFEPYSRSDRAEDQGTDQTAYENALYTFFQGRAPLPQPTLRVTSEL